MNFGKVCVYLPDQQTNGTENEAKQAHKYAHSPHHQYIFLFNPFYCTNTLLSYWRQLSLYYLTQFDFPVDLIRQGRAL